MIIRIINGTESNLLSRSRYIDAKDLDKYRRRLSRLFGAAVEFVYKQQSK